MKDIRNLVILLLILTLVLSTNYFQNQIFSLNNKISQTKIDKITITNINPPLNPSAKTIKYFLGNEFEFTKEQIQEYQGYPNRDLYTNQIFVNKNIIKADSPRSADVQIDFFLNPSGFYSVRITDIATGKNIYYIHDNEKLNLWKYEVLIQNYYNR